MDVPEYGHGAESVLPFGTVPPRPSAQSVDIQRLFSTFRVVLVDPAQDLIIIVTAHGEGYIFAGETFASA